MKFKYNDKVKILEGFYKDQVCLVKIHYFVHEGNDLYEIVLDDGRIVTVYENEIEVL